MHRITWLIVAALAAVSLSAARAQLEEPPAPPAGRPIRPDVHVVRSGGPATQPDNATGPSADADDAKTAPLPFTYLVADAVNFGSTAFRVGGGAAPVIYIEAFPKRSACKSDPFEIAKADLIIQNVHGHVSHYDPDVCARVAAKTGALVLGNAQLKKDMLARRIPAEKIIELTPKSGGKVSARIESLKLTVTCYRMEHTMAPGQFADTFLIEMPDGTRWYHATCSSGAKTLKWMATFPELKNLDLMILDCDMPFPRIQKDYRPRAMIRTHDFKSKVRPAPAIVYVDYPAPARTLAHGETWTLPVPVGPAAHGADGLPTTQPDDARGPASPMEALAGDGRPGATPTSQPDTTAGLELPKRAAARLKLGKYELAEKDFKELAADEKSQVAAALGLAELYRRTGRYAEADKALAGVEALANGPGHAADLADWRCEKAERLVVAGQYEEALALAQAALKADEGNLHARWLLGQQLETLGRIDEAVKVYEFLAKWVTKDRPADAAGKTWAGLSLDRYSVLTSQPTKFATMILQDLYQEAYEKLDREYWPARVAAGQLSLAKYQIRQAAEDLAAALKINPKAYQANLGLGRAALENWQFEAVDKQLEAARKVNAKDPAVCELDAALQMLQRRYEPAAKAAEQGLAVNPRDVRCLALLASAKLRLGDRDKVAELTAAAEKINPRPAEFYFILGEWQTAARQFASAEQYYRKAIELAPWDPNPRTSLGMMYMQTGDESKARDVLEKGFAIDRYNRRSFNTLTLLDQLVAFDTIESPHFVVKFHRDSDGILGPYFRDYLEGIYAELSRDYDIRLPHKTTVEIFPSHAQFSVRTTGRPWIPTVGACTGWVIAMYSPRKTAGTPRGFNWSHVLRHEFTHVVTLAATENRIPHWFTEGLAVSQEPSPRKWKWVRMLTAVLRRNQLLPVDKIDWGFIRPRRPGERELAYAQSEWMVEFIVDRYGYKTINELLKAFRDYKSQPQALKDVLGVSEAEFDKLFKAWATRQVAEEWRLSADPIPDLAKAAKAAKDRPGDAAAQADLAVAHYYNVRDRERVAKAKAAARKALALDANQPKALAVLGTVLAEKPDSWAEAEELLLRLAKIDANMATAPRLLARHALAAGQMERAAFWFQRLKLASPLDPMSYTGLAGIYLDSGQIEQALPELAELARQETNDTRYALKLASLYSQLGKPDQSAVWLDEALHIDPFNPAIHRDLAVAYNDLGQPDRATAELKAAIQLDPDNATYWARLAYIYDAQGRTALARKAAEFSVRLDPDSPAKDLLAKLAPGPGPTTRPD